MRRKNQELMTKMINFIDSEYQKNGSAPTLREIASEFNITSACVSHYLTEMKEKGLIKSNGKSRSIVIFQLLVPLLVEVHFLQKKTLKNICLYQLNF